MNKLKYILVPVLAGLMFTACNNEPKMPSDAELAPQVDAKVKAATDQLKADCDNRMMQAAQMQADSIVARSKGKKPKPATPVAAAPVKPKVPSTPKNPTTKAPVKAPVKPSTKPTTVNDRVGGAGKTNTSAPKTVNDRKGGNDSKNAEAPKSVNDRPGGN